MRSPCFQTRPGARIDKIIAENEVLCSFACEKERLQRSMVELSTPGFVEIAVGGVLRAIKPGIAVRPKSLAGL